MAEAEPIKRLTAEEEKEQIERAQKDVNTCDEVCLITQKWWKSWCNYSKLPHPQIDNPDPNAGRPGVIDNSELCSEDFALAIDPSCSEDYDYQYLTVPAMNLLRNWYGGAEHDFKRKRVMDLTRKRKIVDLNPLFVKIAIVDKDTGKANIKDAKYEPLSRSKTIDDVFRDFKEKNKNVDTRLSVPFRIANASNEFTEENIPESFDQEKLVELTRESKIWALKLEAVACKNGDMFMFEFRNGTEWPSSKVWSHEDIGIGTIGEGLDKYGKWYHMQVIGERVANETKEYFCHWLGFKSTWNEWIKEGDKEEKNETGWREES